MNVIKKHTVLIFGYPLAIQHLGGLVWIKKVVNYIERSEKFHVKKISNPRETPFYKFFFISDVHAIIRGIIAKPDIAMLDTYGEASIWMWLLLRMFCPHAKIAIVFHHYEPLSVRHKNCSTLIAKYYALVDSITKLMLRNSDDIITVSQSSMTELRTRVGIGIDRKVSVVGCSFMSYFSVNKADVKDIDFLCIGRIEKFSEIQNIWEQIRKKRPSSKFVMAGRCSSKELAALRGIGIEHHGIVSDREKIGLYSRAKVFLFPSLFEGFGIAIGEALTARMIVIAWKIPAFEERFACKSNANLRLVEIGNSELFVKTALNAINTYDVLDLSKVSTENPGITQTWDKVGKNVLDALESNLIKRNEHLIGNKR